MAVFDADKDISPGIVVSVPFFGGILALMMIGGTRVNYFFCLLAKNFGGKCGKKDDRNFYRFLSVLCARLREAFPEKRGTKTRAHHLAIASSRSESFLRPFNALCC